MAVPSGLDRRTLLQLTAAAALGVTLTHSATEASGGRSSRIELDMPDLSQRPQSTWRKRLNINRDWKFILGDPAGAQARRYADEDWHSIGLPHSFSLPYFQSTEFYVGYGWYRKQLNIPVDWHGKNISLEFEAAFQHAQVFVNGRLVGEHQGGYTSFTVDITRFVHSGENRLAVRLNNIWNPESAPRAGDHIYEGGLYRNVFLVATDLLHIPFQGVRITTPQVSAQSARVNIQTRVLNSGPAEKRCTVVNAIIDPEGRTIATLRTSKTIPAGAGHLFTHTSQDISQPQLWHPDHPWLYRVQTAVLDGDTPVDGEDSPLGLRWFEWTAEKGFFLNGRHLWIHGANVHQDHAGWASGVTDAGAWRDVKLVKEAGFNFIRTSHYPHSRAFMDACDYYGILIWSEMCFWGVGGFGPDGDWAASAYPVEQEHWAGFEKSCLDQLAEMIAMHRNHPCIIAWSMCNEVFFTNPKVFGRMKNLLVQMVRRTHQLDPTRPAGIGGAQRGGIDKLGDIAGYNGDGATLYLNPGFPTMVTEYGSVSVVRPGQYQPDFGLLQKTQFPWRSGAAIWCAFDYGTWIGRTGDMGIIDYYRLPKRAWFWYRDHNNSVPPPAWPKSGTPARLHLSADRRVIHGTDAIEDSHVIVTVVDHSGRPLSNSPQVTLSIESGPGEFPTGPEIVFDPHSDIRIVDGLAAIEFRSYHSGVSVIRATSPGLPPAFLHLSTTGEPAFIPGQTPRVANRPYIRSPRQNQRTYMTHTSGLINLALNRPTEASSSKAGHSPRFVNDGNSATHWKPEASRPGQWCQIDLEGEYRISEVKLTFSDKVIPPHELLISANGTRWYRAASDRNNVHIFKRPVHGRFVRVVLQNASPQASDGIAEIAVYGHLGGQRKQAGRK